jgi:sigma-B regulation protein RsbU (phosphoserine phosphatase)
MFVTVWLAILEISTGRGMAANAGHEHPVLRRAGGSYELVEYRHSPVVAFLKGVSFREHEFRLSPGDRLVVYTDGVAEAQNQVPELYGTDRMLEALQAAGNASPEEALKALKRSIVEFENGAEQFDDITMLCLDYFGPDAGPKEEA